MTATELENELAGLSREQIVLFYCIGALHRLKRLGLVKGGMDLTQKGSDVYEAMKKHGFTPTDDELYHAMQLLMGT